MPRYKLRTLLILMAVLPPLIAFVWFNWRLVVVASFLAVLVIINWMMHRSTERSAERATRRSVEKSIREGEAMMEQSRNKREESAPLNHA
jgi:hypothetical protein